MTAVRQAMSRCITTQKHRLGEAKLRTAGVLGDGALVQSAFQGIG